MLDGRVIGNMNFMVFIGVLKMSFSKISNLSYEAESETIVEGGRNDAVYLVSKGKDKAQTLVLERGIAENSSLTVKLAGLKPGRVIRDPIIIMVMQDQTKPVRSYYIEEGYVTKWEVGELDASGQSVLIERIEIAHSGLIDSGLFI